MAESPNQQRSCLERVRLHYDSRMDDIRTLWALYREDPEARTEDGECWYEYGLCFDYVPAGTFSDQERGFFRFQLSCGGPQEEFRYYTDECLDPYKIEFWFLDWGDGAHVNPQGADLELIREIWDDWKDCELPQAKIKEAAE